MNLSTAYELKKQISVEMKKGFVFAMYIIVLLILFSSCQSKTKNHVMQLESGKVKKNNSEQFDKTITVYCNAETSPLVLKISGNAK